MSKINVGIIGCGTIARVICEAIRDEIPQMSMEGVYDIDRDKSIGLANRISPPAKIVNNVEELLSLADLIIESASQEACKKWVRPIVEKGKDILVMSVGGLLEQLEVFEIAGKHSAHIYIPSGAISGIDGLKAMRLAGISNVTLTTRKPLSGLMGAAGVIQRGINLNELTEPTIIFIGSVLEAIKAFPANINVAATLSLAGIGPERTEVKIIADPTITHNIHEILIEGKAGKIHTICENLPSPFNPKTSFLAALSAIAVLKDVVASVRIGN